MSSKTKETLPSFDDMTLLYQRFLRVIAIIPFEGRDFNYLPSQLLLAYYITSSIIHWSMYVFYVINEGKITAIDLICETVMVVGIDVRYYLLLHHRLEFTNLLNESRAIWELCDTDGRRAVRQFEQKIRLLFHFLFWSTVLSNVMYSASAVGLNLQAAHLNHTEARFLPFKWYSKNGADLWPGYKIIFPLQVLVIQNVSMVIAAVDTAGSLLIMFGAGYFRALGHRISLITENKDKPISTDCELIACARLHQRIFSFCSRIDRITRILFLVQLLCTGYNMSLAGIKLAGTDPDRFKFVPVTFLQLAQMLAVQWAPDHLIVESTAISWSAYCVSLIWMRRPIGRLLVLIMARSQRPVQMTAAGVIHLSLEKFGTMLTSAVSFFTLLRNFNI